LLPSPQTSSASSLILCPNRIPPAPSVPRRETWLALPPFRPMELATRPTQTKKPRQRPRKAPAARERNQTCKRDSVVVVIHLGRRSPSASSDQPEGRAGHSISLLFGLAPGGVCQASQSPGCWCALTAPFHRCRTAEYRDRPPASLWHFPWGHPHWVLPSTSPYGVPTFLAGHRPARPPGLVSLIQSLTVPLSILAHPQQVKCRKSSIFLLPSARV